MKVVLIPGMTTGLKRTDASKTSMSLGVLTLASNLELNGHETVIQDMDYYIDSNDIRIDHLFYKKVAEYLYQTKANVFGFYVAVGTLHHACNISVELKKIDPSVIIFCGGPHATAVHEEIIEHISAIDYVVRGECDNVIVDFIKALEAPIKSEIKDVSNITYRDEFGKVIANEEDLLICDLDSLSIAAYYKHKTERDVLDVIPIDVGRGCPYNCTFCSTSVFWKKSYRTKSVGRIIEEIKHVKQLFNVKKVFLMHDCLTADRKTLYKICDEIKANQLGVEWGCAARLDHLDNEMLKKLREGNCTHLELGIESGSALVRSSINKKLDSDYNSLISKLQDIHDRGFSLVLFYICGFHNETEEDINATLEMIRDTLNIMRGNGFFRLTYLELFAGTAMYKEEKDKAIFSIDLIDESRLYTEEQIAVAQKTNLFPEFYYVQNETISPLYFRELSSVYSSFIKIIGTEFFLSYKKILEVFNNNIHTFFTTWKEYEDICGLRLRESSIIAENMEGYVKYLGSQYQIPPYLMELVRYELMVYMCRQKFLTSNNVIDNNRGLYIMNAKIGKYKYNIPNILKSIKEEKDVIPEESIGTTYLIVYMVSSEKINIIKINESIFEVLKLCNGKNTIEDILNKLAVRKNIIGKEKDKLTEDMKKMFNNLLNMGILGGLNEEQ